MGSRLAANAACRSCGALTRPRAWTRGAEASAAGQLTVNVAEIRAKP